MQNELELARLNAVNSSVVPSSADSGTHGAVDGIGNQRLDLLIKLVPRFDPADEHLFFTSFERAAVLNNIPRDKSSSGW
jgi:hypothetical protein